MKMTRNKIMFWLFFLLSFLQVTETMQERNKDLKNDPDYCKRHPDYEQCNWHYLAYFPRIFRTGVTEHVMLSTHGYPKSVNINVSVLAYTTGKLYTSKVFKVQPGELTTLPIYIDHNAPNEVKLQISGEGDVLYKNESTSYTGDENRVWIFRNTSNAITVQKLGLNIFIQTDRPVYKPGQKIQARVVVVDSTLKPYQGQIDSIVIENPSSSRMRQWKDVQLEDGFASFELQTSEKPVTGEWKIKVQLKTYKKELAITVKKYVLPKFEVTIEPPSFISAATEKIITKICAKYSYGKDVYGKVTFQACPQRPWWYYRGKRNNLPCELITKKILGCTDITIQSYNFKNLENHTRIQRYNFNASVTESATGIKMNALTVVKDVKENPVTLSIIANPVFKPGFPLDVKVTAKYPDGRLATDINEITLEAGSQGYSSNDLFNGTLKLENGQAPLYLPPIPFNANEVRITATYTRKAIYEKEDLYNRRAYTSLAIKPWYSQSHSYLYIKKYNEERITPVKKGLFTLEVGYSSVDSKEIERDVYYSLMCAGNIVVSGSVKQRFVAATATHPTTNPVTTTTIASSAGKRTTFTNKENTNASTTIPVQNIRRWWHREIVTRPPLPHLFTVASFQLPLDLTNVKASSCKVVVYYMRGAEVVAEDTSIEIEDQTENQIKIQFDHEEVRPGGKTKMVISGSPYSKVAIAAVDKSIHFLAAGNDLKEKDLNEVKEHLNIGPGWVDDWNRCSNYGRKRRSLYYPSTGFVDSEKAFANAALMVLTSLQVDTRPCESMIVAYSIEDTITGTSLNPGKSNTGLFILSSLQIDTRPCSGPLAIPLISESVGIRRIPGVEGAVRKTKLGSNEVIKPQKAVTPRTEFPETWLWTEQRLSENGTFEFDVKVPDTITSWYASGFGVSKSTGLGVAKATELTVFQPFFISLNLPYSVIRGEDVAIPTAVFSYLHKGCISVRVTLGYSTDYRILAGPSAKSCICEGRSITVLFRIRPKKLGRIPIKITAETLDENLCADNVNFKSDVSTADVLIKKLLVEAEGVKDEYTESSFFCPKDYSGSYNTALKLRLPENVVEGSVYSKITAIGDIMGSSLSNIDELLAMPYGCGEQNMLKFAPNIFIMNYLKHTNQVNEEIRSKALNYMLTGYQRELTYQHKDGAYSAFGERDREGSTWLTAFVLKSYAQAQAWIDIDVKDIQIAKNWLIKHQDELGCFVSVGELHHKAMKGGVNSPVTLTAYVVTSLLEAGLNTTSTVANRAKECVVNSLKDVKDSYSLAIILYMFAKLRDTQNYVRVMGRLNDMAINEDGMTHWAEEKAPETTEDTHQFSYYKPRPTDIEQTAYILLAQIQYKSKALISDSLPIVKWLSKQRNSLGGWSSTQDTVLAMQALSEFASLTYREAVNMKVNVRATSSTDKLEHEFDINSNNNLVLQRLEDVPVPSTIKISATGNGCALVQINVQYNIKTVLKKPSFEITHEIIPVYRDRLTLRKSCKSQNIKVCVRWLNEDESNMAIVDVQMVSGFEADQESMEEALKTTRGLKDVEIKGKGVMYYFNRLDSVMRCFVLRVHQTTSVKKTKSVPITVYDYYDTEKAATTMYHFTEKQCNANQSDNEIEP